MPRSTTYTFTAVVMATALILSGCGTTAPPTPVPTNTNVPLTSTTEPIATVTTPPTSTSDPATPTDTVSTSPVTGSVLIEGGNSVAGGVSGSRIQLDVEFTAESTAGQVTEMRVDTSLPGGCMSGGLGGIPWEPFVPQKVYTTTAFGNFQGWYINVQYRDDAQNISSVYCDDISIEGMPPTPTR